jgi:hypothetical protein
MASVNALITYSFKHMTLNGGETSILRSRSTLKLNERGRSSSHFVRSRTHSSSLMSFGRTARNCSIGGMYDVVANMCCCSAEDSERIRRFLRSRLERGITNSVAVRLLQERRRNKEEDSLQFSLHLPSFDMRLKMKSDQQIVNTNTNSSTQI